VNKTSINPITQSRTCLTSHAQPLTRDNMVPQCQWCKKFHHMKNWQKSPAHAHCVDPRSVVKIGKLDSNYSGCHRVANGSIRHNIYQSTLTDLSVWKPHDFARTEQISCTPSLHGKAGMSRTQTLPSGPNLGILSPS
jgi:hypothetical protein